MIQELLSFKLLLLFLKIAVGSCMASFIIGNPRIINFIKEIKAEVDRWEKIQSKKTIYAISAIIIIAGFTGNVLLINHYYHQLPPEVWQKILQL
jgi:hypothetical protein